MNRRFDTILLLTSQNYSATFPQFLKLKAGIWYEVISNHQRIRYAMKRDNFSIPQIKRRTQDMKQ